jgi:chromosome segregation ATPase
MAIKKKVGISDLLRDEVQKGTDSNSNELVISNIGAEQTIEVKAETINDPQKDLRAEVIADSKRISELESSLKSLQTRSPERESELLQAIASLRQELQFSHTNIELLQKSLAAIESLKNELDQQLVEVKRDNLRLAEANIQLSEQIKTFEAAQNSAQAAEPINSSQLATQSTNNNRATPRKQPVEQPYPQRDRIPYARPTGSNEQLQRINNKNIGWMD